MRPSFTTRFAAASLWVSSFALAGCHHQTNVELPIRPDEVSNFDQLYNQNCAACHGHDGHHGAAISLANPLYLAVAGPAVIEHVTQAGVNGSLMPGFSASGGGFLTDQQIHIITVGMIQRWGKADVLAGVTAPAYAASAPGDAQRGQAAFESFCVRCHAAQPTTGPDTSGPNNLHGGSLVDPAYLALISDQGLRSYIIAGQPEEGMPDFRHDGAQPMTDQQITDTVAWLSSQRTQTPGQVYTQHP